MFASHGVEVRLDHATFVHNSAGRRFGALRTRRQREVSVSNSIFWLNEPFHTRAEFTYSILDREDVHGTTNRNSFPLFIDPGPPFFPPTRAASRSVVARSRLTTPAATLATGSGNYQLLPGSPAIDAGDPNARTDPDDTHPDIGALFFEQPLRGFIRGDLDGTGVVDWGDGLTLLRHLLLEIQIPCRDAADVDDDGRVNLIDAVLLAWFLSAGRDAPAHPFPGCGVDPTFGEGLSCQGGSGACGDPAR